MPSAISRTYGKKAPVKRKTTPSDDEESSATKRRRVTPSEDEQEPCPKPKPKAGSPLPSPSKPGQTATPTKMTKRMLGRSKTESSIENQNSSAMASRTCSLPVVSSSSSVVSSSSSQPLPPSDDHSHDLLPRPTLSASASTPRVKRTYAGHSRSFLVSLPVSDLNPEALPSLDAGGQEDDFYEPESYSSLRLRWGVDNLEDDPAATPLRPNSKSKSKSNSTNGTPASKKGKGKGNTSAIVAPAVYLPPNMMNPLKSITELRSKGESRRFLDEVGYLFEGMDPSNSAGLKRSSASEITAKLCDDEFARKAKAADFYHKTWDVFLRAGAGRGEDKILDILLIFLLALIARNADTLLDLATQEPSINKSDTESTSKGKGKQKAAADTSSDVEHMDTFISILFFILKTSADVDLLFMVSQSTTTDLDFKRIGLSKKDKLTLSAIHSTISHKSNLFPSKAPITTTLLTTHILTHLPPSLLPSDHLPDLLHSLRSLIHTTFPPNEPFDGRYPSYGDKDVIELSSDDDDVSDHQGGGGGRGNRREPQYECIKHHLHLLDMYLLGQWSPSSSIAGDGGRGGVGKALSATELDKARDEWFVDGLIAISVCSEMNLRRQAPSTLPPSSDSASECLEILLRVFVNLTHDDPGWAQSVISNEFAVAFIVRLVLVSLSSSSAAAAPRYSKIKVEDDEIKPKLEDDDSHLAASSHYQQSAWDRLCLALGLLTNLVQSVPEFKNVLRRTKVSTKCVLSDPACTKKCACPSSSQICALEALVKVYNTYSPPSTSISHPRLSLSNKKHKQLSPPISSSSPKPIKREPSPPSILISKPSATGADDEGSTSTSLILSTLSILFGLLMSSSPQNQSMVLSCIDGVDDERIKLERLVRQAKEFVLLYDDAAGSNQDGGSEGEMKNVKEVVRVLERLRDEC